MAEICHAAADSFIRLLDNSNISIVVPGGNTPRDFFISLTLTDIDWSKICLILSDERMVSVNHKASNYGMIKETILKKLPKKNKPVVIPNMENFKETNSKEFLEKTIFSLKGKFPIKHAFLGIGSDGHTASLFPGSNMVSRDDESFFYIKKRGESYQRMTLSMHFLLNMPNLTFLVSGKSKHDSLKKILNGCNINNKSPAHQLVDKSNGQVSIFCDQETWPGKVYA